MDRLAHAAVEGLLRYSVPNELTSRHAVAVLDPREQVVYPANFDRVSRTALHV